MSKISKVLALIIGVVLLVNFVAIIVAELNKPENEDIKAALVTGIDRASEIEYNGKPLKDYNILDLRDNLNKDLGDLAKHILLDEEGNMRISEKATEKEVEQIQEILDTKLE